MHPFEELNMALSALSVPPPAFVGYANLNVKRRKSHKNMACKVLSAELVAFLCSLHAPEVETPEKDG